MNIKKLAYPTAVVLLMIAFNISLIGFIKSKEGLSISIGILFLLLALIVFKNRTFKLDKNKNQIIALGICGIALTIINVQVALAYAVVGLFLLTATQLKIMLNGKPIWFLTGGNPLHKLNEKESRISSIGLAMMLSVAFTFFIKVVWLSNTV